MKRINTNDAEYSFGGAHVVKNAGTIRIALSYKGAYGCGEKYDNINLKGRTVVNKVVEHFCFQGDKTYCPIPFFFTESGFGFYADTYKETSFAFGEDEITIELPSDAEAVLFSGTPSQIVSEYMSLFGKAVLPPEWVFGVWASANRWNSGADVDMLLDNLKKHDFPASVIVLEAWSDEATFYIWNGAKYTPKANGEAFTYDDFDFSDSQWPDPKEMIERIHNVGAKLLLWQAPIYKKMDKGEEENEQNELDRADAKARRLCVMKPDGTPYTIPEGKWFNGSMVPDFTNPDTLESWFGKRRYLLDIGVDGFKTDGGEFIHDESAVFACGLTGKEEINKYPVDYEKGYMDFVGSGRVIFSRAGYSGQHLLPCHWGGDQQSVNEELASVLKAGLSAAASGIIFWGFDLAGFAGPLPSLDLYRRATQMACFTPIMQWHSEPDGGQFKELMPGAEGNNERSPWNMERSYGAVGFADEMRYWHKLHEELRPYLVREAKKCVDEGKPLMRPLVYEWPSDENVIDIQDEYMLGDELLVAPLLEEDMTEREVYLPEGTWENFFDKKIYSGCQRIVSGGNGKLPVFKKKFFGNGV